MFGPLSTVAGGAAKYVVSCAEASAQYPDVHW